MGEVFGKNTSKLRIVILLSFMLLAVSVVHASHREFELFNKGYEFYLSYQPEKAVEEFRIFLQEFPDSSAKDAALFWLGKSLIQLKSTEEAKRIFSDMKQLFRDSPFIGYIDKELEIIRRLESEVLKGKTAESDAAKIHSVPENKSAEAEKKMQITENDLSRAAEDRDKLKFLLDEEKKKTEKIQARLKELEVREAFMINSSIVLNKLGIKEVIWRSGNMYEDMEIEQILYEKAQGVDISADTMQHKEIVEKYQLNTEQADYLFRYLTISRFIDRKLKDMPEEKMVESLKVVYKEDDKYRRIILSTELQTQAKSGISFEDIHKLYPDIITFTTVRFQELEAWIKEKIRSLQNNEIGVIWLEDRYMILKPVLKKLSFKPFEEADPEIKNKIKLYIKDWVNESRDDR